MYINGIIDSKSVHKSIGLRSFRRREDINLLFNSFEGYEMGGQQKKEVLYFNTRERLQGVHDILWNEYRV